MRSEISPSSGRAMLSPSRACSLARVGRGVGNGGSGSVVVAGGVRSSSSARAVSSASSCLLRSARFQQNPPLITQAASLTRAAKTGPPTSRSGDHARSIELAFAALHFATGADRAIAVGQGGDTYRVHNEDEDKAEDGVGGDDGGGPRRRGGRAGEDENEEAAEHRRHHRDAAQALASQRASTSCPRGSISYCTAPRTRWMVAFC